MSESPNTIPFEHAPALLAEAAAAARLPEEQIVLLRWHARLHGDFQKQHARREFLRGTLACDDAGVQWITPGAVTGSHRLRGAADADALLVLAEGPQSLQHGDVVEVLTF